MKISIKHLMCIFTILTLVSCDKFPDRYNNLIKPNQIDNDLKRNRDDYDKADRAALELQKVNLDEGILPIEPIMQDPEQPKILNEKLVTLAVSNDIDVKDILLELARLAEIDIQIGKNVSGNIILKVKDKPLSEVIDRVCELASLRYSFKNNVLQIEADSPYLETYSVDFLNLVRTNKSNFKIKTGLDGQSSGSTLGSGSDAEISSIQDSDIWGNLVSDINAIINNSDNNNVISQIVNAPLINKEAGKSTGGGGSNSENVSINKQAGILSIKANYKTHKYIKKYLSRIKMSMSAQALIEAKVVEVTLNDEYKTGINWNVLNYRYKGLGASFPATSPIGSYTTGTAAFTLGMFNKNTNSSVFSFDPTQTDDLMFAVNLMELFGATRTLSSPRLHAMNNQQAILSFAQNYVYFKLNIQKTDGALSGAQTTSATETNVTSELKTVPIGLILALQPSINIETNEITMSIRPTLTKIVSTTKDPSIAYALSSQGLSSSDLSSEVPIVEVKELDSVLKTKSGEIMVIGGMMEETYNSNDNGIPVLQDIPIAGNLFKSSGRVKQTVQTVIFIKATIINAGNSYSPSDKKLYNDFTNDPNPLDFER